MRPIGRLSDENQAQHFGDFLYAQGIENQVDVAADGRWEIWVLDDDKVEPAQQALTAFTQQPDDPRFAQAARVAVRRRKQDEQAKVGKRTRMIDGRMIFYSPPVPVGILSIVLIAISVGVAILTELGARGRFVQPLLISQDEFSADPAAGLSWLPEVRHGQIWRLFTPIFLHFGFLHIFFNMLWLRDLGSVIEARKSPWLLLALVVVIAGISNVAQYLVAGPIFGGMSGVVYGLLGYVWMQGKFNPASQLSLEPQTVTFMILWFFVCLFGLVGNVANMAHAAGLILGIAWGFLDAHLSGAMRRG